MAMWESIGVGLAVAVGSSSVTWVVKDWLAGRRARASVERARSLVSKSDCQDCREEWEALLDQGDEQLDVLSRGMALLLRWLPKLCEAVEHPDCKDMEAEANALADELLRAGKRRHRKG